MKLYRCKIKLLSPAGTPWQSDTLFGHLCWQKLYRDGENAFKEFIGEFENGKPLFVLSDGFPAGYLPKPLSLTVSVNGQPAKEVFNHAKKWNKAKFIKVEQFQKICRDTLSIEIESENDIEEPEKVGWKSVESLHASINRESGTTSGEDDSGGALFQLSGQFPCKKDRFFDEVDIYVRADDEGFSVFNKLFDDLSYSGYGKDKSIGFGQFKVLGYDEVKEFDSVYGANGFVSISTFVPGKSDPVEGQWKIRVKRGKLGEHLVHSENPFKNPLLQFEPGAVFHCGDQIKPWYGSIVRGLVPTMPEIIQNCQTIALPIKLSR